MARLTGALFSLAASGTIADTLTFANWKGIQYVRTRVIPANPKSLAQQEVRGVFATLNQMWKRMPYLARNPFIFAARGQPLTARNKHIQANVKALIDQTDLNNLVMSVPTGSAVIPDNVVVDVTTPFHIIITADAPISPIGYTLYDIRAAAVLDGDPSPVLTRTTYAGNDLITPYSIDITVPAAGIYQVGVWCAFNRDSDQRGFQSAAVRSQDAVVDA